MEELFSFLTEYTAFFEKMEETQQEKLSLLLTRELKKIEQSIMVQQAMDKQLENMERRRQALFAASGLEGKTFREVIIMQPKEKSGDGSIPQREWQALFERLEHAISNIRYYNREAEKIARTELVKAGADPGNVDPASGIYRPDYGGRKNMFVKKI